MSLGRPEKLAQHLHSGARKQRAYEKNRVHRRLRQLVRTDVENAPTKVGYRGWYW